MVEKWLAVVDSHGEIRVNPDFPKTLIIIVVTEEEEEESKINIEVEPAEAPVVNEEPNNE